MLDELVRLLKKILSGEKADDGFLSVEAQRRIDEARETDEEYSPEEVKQDISGRWIRDRFQLEQTWNVCDTKRFDESAGSWSGFDTEGFKDKIR